MRYANVFGPRQDPKSEAGVVSIFVSRLLANQTAHRLRRRPADPGLRLRPRRRPRQRAGHHRDAARGTGEFDAHRVQHRDLASSATCSSWRSRWARSWGRSRSSSSRRRGRASCSAARSTSARPRRCWAGRREWKFEDGLRQLVDWFQKEGAVILQAGGAVPRSAVELVLTASTRDQDRARHHRDLLSGLLVHHHPEVVAVPAAQPPGRQASSRRWSGPPGCRTPITR